jgi:D-alanine-D-alanine ligase
MAKAHAQSIWEAHGIKTIPTLTFSKGDHIDFDSITKKFPGKLIIKSETTGSSFGVTLLKDVKEYYFRRAINTAFNQSNRVLIQPFIDSMVEIECAILQLPDGTVLPCGPGTVLSKKDKDNDIYSYENKYNGSGDSLLIPSPISEELREKIRTDATIAFKALGCSGFARVDFFLQEDGTLFINEINTLPGLTNTSHFPLLVESEGIPLSSAISIIMEDALQEDND